MCFLKNHKEEEKIYTLDSSAFEKIHDDLVSKKMKTDNEKVQGILSKARGYTARIGMILHVLEQGLKLIVDQSCDHVWDTFISANSVEAAGRIITHFNKQNLIMLGGEITESDNISKNMLKLLCMESHNGDGVISLTEISQKHVCEKVGTSYPTV